MIMNCEFEYEVLHLVNYTVRKSTDFKELLEFDTSKEDFHNRSRLIIKRFVPSYYS